MADDRDFGPESIGERVATRRVVLDLVCDDDLPLIYELLVSPDVGGLFKWSGRIPPPRVVWEHLGDGVLAQWMVTTVTDHKRLGLVSIGSADLLAGYAYISALGVTAARRSGMMVEGVALAVDYAFRQWPLRKLYAELAEASLQWFRSGTGRYFQEEGRLKEHRFVDGRFVDVVTLAVYRSHWQALVEKHGHARRTIDVLATELADEGSASGS